MPRQRSLIYTIVAAVIATAIGIALSFAIHWFPAQASTQARNTDRLYHVLVIASVPIFVLVVTVILYCAWRFRMKPGEELKDGPPIHGNTRLEVVWTAAPAILLLGLISYSFVVLHDNEKKPAREIDIGVTGQQFEWSFQYPPSVTGGKPLETHQLYLPEGESVKFDMRSKDVIHAFWIPAFRIQEDVVPGITTHWRATPDRVGSYPIVCNLLCGVGHSTMRSKVHVMPEAEFDSWLKSELSVSTASASTGGGASAGATGKATG
ncbi:MAG TPA: cytochrome c oxidase subunit II [Solirubrobacteraceae bacterium]|jgi:cytochrome c oxidase subunit 2|nr:cytochrome c oxidase subunit II [Solirubrobacteraceae bacterium]